MLQTPMNHLITVREDSVSIRSHTPQTVQFFSNYRDQDFCLLAAVNLDNWVERIQKCMSGDYQHESSDIIRAMNAMEQRLRSGMDSHALSVSKTVSMTGDKIIGHVGQLRL